MESTWQTVLKAISSVVLFIGVIIFLFGDRFLREIYHWRFVSAEVTGIGSGLLIASLGGALKMVAGKKD
jgi:hypothetical protein